jgi:hypothetical protein
MPPAGVRQECLTYQQTGFFDNMPGALIRRRCKPGLAEGQGAAVSFVIARPPNFLYLASY